MCLAVLLGSTTTWVFMVCILFVISNPDLVSTASSGPLLQIYYQATNNLAGAVCLVIFNLVAM